MAPGTVVTFSAKITAVSGTTLKMDVNNNSIALSTDGNVPPPAPSDEVLTSVTVTIPANVAITLADGKSGKLSDIKAGQTAVFTQVDNDIKAIAIQK